MTFSTELSQLQTLDESTVLYFIDLSYMAALLAASFVVYGVFAIATNILAGALDTTRMKDYLNQISLASKINHLNSANCRNYIAEAWLGLFMVGLWTIFFVRK